MKNKIIQFIKFLFSSNNKTSFFVNKQLDQIKKGGFPVLINKAKIFLLLIVNIVIAIPFIPLILVIRALRPLILIRFKKLRSDRIGHLAYEPDIYLLERYVGLHDKKTVDFFYCDGPVSNQQLKLMWSRRFPFFSKLVLPLDRTNRLLPGGYRHIVPFCETRHEDPLSLQDKYGPQLSFTPEEEKRGKEGLKSMGINHGAKFICFHSRDSAYLASKLPKSDYTYHDYRDSSIQNYVRAIESLHQKFYNSIRIGAIIKEAITTTDSKIVDYASSNHRSDFMDIYLVANCYFFLGTNSGPCALATIFRKPVAFANVAPFHGLVAYRSLDIFIPKKYWSIKEQRFLTFDEILKSGAANYYESNMFTDAGLTPIENTSEEIRELAIEMDDKLVGVWVQNTEDEMLHKKYNEILVKNGVDPKLSPSISTSFLRRNRSLLI